MANNQKSSPQASPASVQKSGGGVNKILIILLFLLTSLLFFVGGAFVFWLYQDKLPFSFKKEASPSPSVLPSPSVIAPEASAPEASLEPSLAPAPTEVGKSDAELIREALALRHGKPVADTTANIGELRLPYASGGVKFAGEIGGAWFLAYKTDSGWVIVQDGNGTVTCELIEPYAFPVDMVPECWQESTGTLITR